MAVSAEYREHIRDIFQGVEGLSMRRMFGGLGIYVGDACFALVVNEGIMMRGDDTLGPAYEAAGSKQWIYQNDRRGPVAMPYWRLPERAMDDPEEALEWAERSLVPAREAAAEKAARGGTSPNLRK